MWKVNWIFNNKTSSIDSLLIYQMERVNPFQNFKTFHINPKLICIDLLNAYFTEN